MRPPLFSRLIALDVLVGVGTALVVRPYVELPSWVDALAALDVLLALATLAAYVGTPKTPTITLQALLGWLAIFIVGLGPFGSPGPWWFGPYYTSWVSNLYAIGLPQLIGLVLAALAIYQLSPRAARA